LFRENLNILLIPESGEDVASFRVRRSVVWSILSAVAIVFLLVGASIRLLIDASGLHLATAVPAASAEGEPATAPLAGVAAADGPAVDQIFFPPEPPAPALPEIPEAELFGPEPLVAPEPIAVQSPEPSLLASFGPAETKAGRPSRVAPAAPAGVVVRAAALGLGDEDEPVLRYVSSRERGRAADASEFGPAPGVGGAPPRTPRTAHDRVFEGRLNRPLEKVEPGNPGRTSALDFIPSGSPLQDAGALVSGFGYRRDPFTGRRAFHAGLDISSAMGTPIYSTADGVVIHSGRDGFLGKCVKIDHGNGIITVYAHNHENFVEVGDQVKRGDMIAEVGSTGRATGPHVHYGVIVDNEHVNPLGFLSSDEVAD